MITIILLVFLLPFIIIKFIGDLLKLLTLICLIGAVILFSIFIITFYVLKYKKFFTKYNYGWKKVATNLLKYSLIIEMISNVICFLLCLCIKYIFKF